MGLNWEATDSHWFVDQEHKMMLFRDPSWVVEKDEGRGDAIGRSFEAWIAYGDKRFLEGIENCWELERRKTWIGRILKGKYYYQGYRYPVRFPNEVGMSRDHLIYTLLSMKLSGKTDKEMWQFVKKLRFKISDFARFTPALWLWVRAISGRRISKFLYPRINYPFQKLNTFTQRKFQKFLGFGPDFEEHQYDFKHMQNDDKPTCVRKLSLLLYPVYALHMHSWKLRCLPDGRWKRKLQEESYKIVPTYNYAIKLLLEFSEDVKEQDVMLYRSMVGGRWTGIMNKWWNDRELKVNMDLDSIKYNVLDVDYIRKLWDQK